MGDTGPVRLADVLARLFIERGWGRKQERLRVEQAWSEAAGEQFAAQTRVRAIRRGVLEITVGNGVLMQELAHFHKRRLLSELQQRLPGMSLTDLRFRAGLVK